MRVCPCWLLYLAKIAKSAFISAFTVIASNPGSTGEVVAPCKVMAGLLHRALTMKSGLVSRSRVHFSQKDI